MVLLIIKCVIFGFIVAIPVGPIGIICIRRTLVDGRLFGFLSGFGVAVADGLFAFVAVFGLTAISGFVTEYSEIVRIGGSLFLLCLAAFIFFSNPAKRISDVGGVERTPFFKAFNSMFLVTLANPSTILSFIALFAVLNIAVGSTSFITAFIVMIGVLAGSTLWWLLCSKWILMVKDRFVGELTWINKISAVVIALFAVLSFFNVF